MSTSSPTLKLGKFGEPKASVHMFTLVWWSLDQKVFTVNFKTVSYKNPTELLFQINLKHQGRSLGSLRFTLDITSFSMTDVIRQCIKSSSL